MYEVFTREREKDDDNKNEDENDDDDDDTDEDSENKQKVPHSTVSMGFEEFMNLLYVFSEYCPFQERVKYAFQVYGTVSNSFINLFICRAPSLTKFFLLSA